MGLLLSLPPNLRWVLKFRKDMVSWGDKGRPVGEMYLKEKGTATSSGWGCPSRRYK